MSTVIRAVYDIGSGSTKLLVAEVDEQTRTITRELFGQERPVAYKADTQKNKNGGLSAGIQDVGLSTLRDLREVARSYGATPKASYAVATEVFRTAPNGGQYPERVPDHKGWGGVVGWYRA